MAAYIVRRVLILIPTLLGVSIIIFFMLHITPGDPAELLLGERASEQALQEMREHLGLNKPLYSQYGMFLKRLITFDLGETIWTRQKVVFNRLQDLEKIVGASAEMFWRGARPGYQGKIDKDAQMTTADKEELQDQLDEFEHNLRRLLILQNMSLDSLSPQVADPSNHVDIQIQMISAVTGIPKRILTGSERGELASTADKNTWFGLIDGRRGEFAEPCIIRPFVDRCIEYGIIPKPKADYGVKWPDLWATGDKEKAEIGRIRATALKEYSSMPTTESIVPPRAFLEVIMGLRPEEIEIIDDIKEKEVGEEEMSMAGAEEEMATEGQE